MNAALIKALYGAAIGVAVSVTFLVGFKIGETKGRERAWIDADKQMDEMEDRLKRLYKVGEYSAPFIVDESMDSPEHELARRRAQAAEDVDPDMLRKLQEHIETQAYKQLHDVVPKEIILGRGNVFDQFTNEDASEGGEEVEGVTPNMDDPEPYAISEEEFDNSEEHHTKISLQYYPIDEVVADEQDRVVDDVESAIGRRNLLGFNSDTTVIYVRNNRIHADFEIAIEEGSYRETVLGVESGPVMERRGRKSRSTQDE